MPQRTWRRWSKCFLFYQYGIFSCLLFSFFSIKYFFYGYWQLTGQQGKGGNCLLFHPVTSNHSQSFRHLFVILHVRFLSHIFNRNDCIDEIYHLIELLFDSLMMWCWFSFVFLLIWFYVLLQLFYMRSRWARTRINYHLALHAKGLTKGASHTNLLHSFLTKHVQMNILYFSQATVFIF